ncbi:hypothetical protein BAX94_14875 [Elizabethkingia meningoseptica]|uniref:Zf-HC2 domain-containing protein n=2 Tax=Weeksellaceae TaxID=2762318 RepID=A0A1V3U3N0_ELIME|nr:hypothetical protein [Elizabethkingia meningoseptica]AQX11113.1 hypothetical protein BBD35_01390 [Elizabethkingia meningoseptica]ODM52014.1 hypothetical protein BES09_14595 [Elizabethkingia meningoseptica]OHT26372.1 hypothetical protein BFF93_17550 [Elizabethkingia meningoseptica]OHT26667.1 hypothetical protein BGC12_15630 [Elizabethkingia meningoseptica]OOH97557.1 hypothetical protein BMF97_02745 [Elizabethkingia meningoseptica]
MKTLKKIIHFLILPCSKATFLIEKRMHTPLTFIEKIRLNAHLTACKWCISYDRKARFLHEALKNLVQKKESETPVYSIDNKLLKEEVLKKIKK